MAYLLDRLASMAASMLGPTAAAKEVFIMDHPDARPLWLKVMDRCCHRSRGQSNCSERKHHSLHSVLLLQVAEHSKPTSDGVWFRKYEAGTTQKIVVPL